MDQNVDYNNIFMANENQNNNQHARLNFINNNQPNSNSVNSELQSFELSSYGNYYTSSSLEIQNQLQRPTEDRAQAQIMCQNCDTNLAGYECLDCTSSQKSDVLFCKDCADFHPKVKLFKNHILSLIRITRPPIALRNETNFVNNANIGVHISSKNRRCEHNREQRDCKECGGSRICGHGKYKRSCRSCGGSDLCLHGKHKRICKQCHGTGICIHNKQKQGCKECHGSGICEHNHHKRACLECQGRPSRQRKNPMGSHKKCIHNRETRDCRDCGGQRICDHGKRKTVCANCKNMGLNNALTEEMLNTQISENVPTVVRT